MSDRVILGIDPGTNFMGYGLIEINKNKPSLIVMGVIDLSKFSDPYLKLGRIYERVVSIIDQYHPDELAIEAPFFGKNVQSMLKLGRAQGVAMAAALSRELAITEYAPLKIKMSITGSGAASKEQVSAMVQRILKIKPEQVDAKLDATDAVAAALCHYYQSSRPQMTKSYSNWGDFIAKNPTRVKK